MVSDFIDEHGGYLHLSPEEHEMVEVNKPDISNRARVVLEFCAQIDGYWNSEGSN